MKTERRALLGLAAAVAILTILVAIAWVKSSDANSAASQAAAAAQAYAQSVSAAATLAQGTANRLADDEQKTCVLQGKALPATHVLSGALYDLSAITAHIPKPQGHLSRYQRRELHLLRELHRKARRYARIEHKLPATRHC